MTGFKNIVATLYLKNGQAVKSASDMTVMGDVYNLCQLYNDSGIDKIIIFDLSTDDDEHEKNIHTIENINRNIDIKVCRRQYQSHRGREKAAVCRLSAGNL